MCEYIYIAPAQSLCLNIWRCEVVDLIVDYYLSVQYKTIKYKLPHVWSLHGVILWLTRPARASYLTAPDHVGQVLEIILEN